MMLAFKTRKENKAKMSLGSKIKTILQKLAWAENGNFSIEKVCDLFNTLEKELKNITEREWKVAPKSLSNVSRSTGRDKYGWFRAENGNAANTVNTHIQPTGHFDEYFRTHTVAQLMTFNNDPSDQGGFAKKGVTTREFYLVAFVKPFIMDKYKALKIAHKELLEK
jgi:hypothetical protein